MYPKLGLASVCLKYPRLLQDLATDTSNFQLWMESTRHDFFSGNGGMPSVVGCLDCTHIKIVRPRRNDTEIFRCRKGYFSLNVQAICGPSLLFYNVVCRWPGSVHDSRIFDNSTIRDVLEDGRLPGHLLGDSAYPCRRYLLTPLLSPNGPHEAAYNTSHVKTKNCIDRAFRLLKRRFCNITN